MNLPFYTAMRQTLPSSPNEYYRDFFQELVNVQWDNTTTIKHMEEQDEIGSPNFHPIEVRMTHVLDRSTGVKQGEDFRKIMFRDIERNVFKGRYYRFDHNYWIVINTDEMDRISKHVVIRRCNNFLRYRDPEDNHIVEIPCIMEYDTSSPSPQVNNDVITPNNHAVFITQGNEQTYKLIQGNLRIMFGGRPFKVTGFNNYLETYTDGTIPYLIYVDAYLDEVSPYDTPEIAYNFYNNYTIELDKTNFENVQGYQTQLTATVLDNGESVERNLTWLSSDETVLTVDNTGMVQLVGEAGKSATITAQLQFNPQIQTTITIGIVKELTGQTQLIMEPLITSVPQGQSVEFSINAYIDGVKQSSHVLLTPSGPAMEHYWLEQTGHYNEFKLTNLKMSDIPLMITADCRGDKHEWLINLTSIF